MCVFYEEIKKKKWIASISPETCRTRVPRDQSRARTAVSRAESFPQFAVVPGDSRVTAYAARQSQITRFLRCRQLLRFRAVAMHIADVQLLFIGAEVRLLQRLATAAVRQILRWQHRLAVARRQIQTVQRLFRHGVYGVLWKRKFQSSTRD